MLFFKAALLSILFLSIGFVNLGRPAESVDQNDRISQNVRKNAEQSEIEELTVSKCLDLLEAKGAKIPDFGSQEALEEFVGESIQCIIEDLDYPSTFNYVVTAEFAEAIKDCLVDYYGSNLLVDSSLFWFTSDTLSESEVYGEWKDSYSEFNCYAYSIARSEQPNQFPSLKPYQPGDFSNTGTFQFEMSIDDLTPIIVSDLMAIGYQNVNTFNSFPTQYGDDYEIICVRVGKEDYHFMRYIDGEWYHKPGNTWVLKYKYAPSNSRVWTNECVESDGTIKRWYTIYDSEIRYIVYEKNSLQIAGDQTSSATVKAGKDYTFEFNVETTGNYDITVTGANPITSYLYNDEIELISSASAGTAAEISAYLSAGNSYYFRVYNGNDEMSVGLDVHLHDYTAPYAWKNYTQHRSSCLCGDGKIDPHIVLESSLSGSLYANCLLCKGKAKVGFVSGGLLSTQSVALISESGSYVLPNGVIVLSKEDFENYLNGGNVFA